MRVGNGNNGCFDINIDIDKRNIVKAYTTISRDKFVCRECVRQKGKTRSRGNLVYEKKTEKHKKPIRTQQTREKRFFVVEKDFFENGPQRGWRQGSTEVLFELVNLMHWVRIQVAQFAQENQV